MTTKIKIIAGFFFMVLLLAVVNGLNYKDLQDISGNFSEYNRLSKFNSTASDLTTYVSAAESDIYKFLDDKKEETMEAAGKKLEMAGQKIKECQSLVARQDRRATLEQMMKDLQEVRNLHGKVKTLAGEAYRQYLDIVQPAGREMGKALLGIAEQAKSVNSSVVAYEVSNSLHAVIYVRSSISRFAESRSGEDAARIGKLIGELQAALENIVPQTDSGRALKVEVDKAFSTLKTAFTSMTTKSRDVEQSLTAIRGVLAKVTASAAKLSSEVDTQANAMGDTMRADIAQSQRELFIFAGVGLLAGIGCALMIVLGLIRVLKEMSAFAGAIAKGDFRYRITVKEKGEIGTMIEAMQHIPKTLEDVIAQARALGNRISSGFMRDRMDASTLPGTFGEIATSTNAVGDAYLALLDTMAMPIMACDKGNTIVFLNQAGQGVLGGNLVNRKCADLLNAPECGTENCIGNGSVSRNAPCTKETTINVQGKQLNVSVTSLPLRDLSREIVGYVEVLTDLTEIRTQQKAVMNAVAKASEISDRVAAASEELAAQVEQISRGAERQRSRVESTASAMSEMNSTVLEVARSAGQASEQSEDTRRKAEGGAGLVSRVVQSINTVNSVAATLQGNMQDLGKQAEDIGGVMNVISDIADQTNLLALNAAIEAARAGEAGRGFAVVADEVRKLAEKTMSATQEVGSNIQAIQNSARMNIEEVGNAAKNVHEATELANSSGEALKEIVDLASANSAIVASIATAAEQQSATSEEINQAVEEISRITNETTEGMVQSSSAVQDLSRMAQDLRRVMETLK